jgi:streptomycin 6-kinase
MEHLGIDEALLAERERLDGMQGREFLEGLPELVSHWQQELGLTGARIMPGGVLSGVFACTRIADRAAVVLKLTSERAGSAVAEAAALRAWDGRGACRLLFASADSSAMLLERILPGDPVRPASEASDAQSATQLLRRLHLRGRLVPEIPDASAELDWRFARAHTMLDGSNHVRGIVSHQDIDRAHERALELHSKAEDSVLLHGDFINKNLLVDHHGAWQAIDPRPCFGDPCLDLAFWAIAQRPNVAVRERCEAAADAAGLDPERVWAWALAFAVCEAVLVRSADRAHAHAALAGLTPA